MGEVLEEEISRDLTVTATRAQDKIVLLDRTITR